VPFEVVQVSNATADAILAWCGVTSPTPADIAVATQAAAMAEDTIRHYRGLDDAPAWEPERVYALRDVVRPSRANDHLYLCTTAGLSDDDTEPTWPTTSGATVTDGTVVWTEYVRPFEEKYRSLAVEMGVYAYNKRGVDGALAFSENGVSQSYEAGSFPKSMLARITPKATTG
jgi:hypothetical protein